MCVFNGDRVIPIDEVRLIAKWMGIAPAQNGFDKKWVWGDGIFFMTSCNTFEEAEKHVLEYLYKKYQSQWNYIMPVLERIGACGYKWTISQSRIDTAIPKNVYHYCTILKPYRELITSIEAVSPMDAVYGAVVTFLKWRENCVFKDTEDEKKFNVNKSES